MDLSNIRVAEWGCRSGDTLNLIVFNSVNDVESTIVVFPSDFALRMRHILELGRVFPVAAPASCYWLVSNSIFHLLS